MLPFEDIRIQLVDTPPITNLSTQGRLYGLLRMSDVLVGVVDLSSDPVSQVREAFQALEDWGFLLMGNGNDWKDPDSELAKPVIIAGNKADIPGSLDSFQWLEVELGGTYPVLMVSAEEEVGLDELGEEIFRALGVIRVYTKSPQQKREEVQRGAPFVLLQGTTVGVASAYVHNDLVRSLKYAVLWGRSGKFEGQHVGRDHQLHDGDLIELHT
jgi:ribosome-interacting GTPase 1